MSSQTRPLSPKAAQRMAGNLSHKLGRADRERLEALLTLFNNAGADDRIRLGDALAKLFPKQGRTAALTAFRQFRRRLSSAAKEAAIELVLEADTQTRAAPEQRWCWFEGEDGAAQAAIRFGREETGGTRRSAQIAVALSDTRDGKPLVRYFVSYAHKDKNLKEDLMDRLADHLKNVKGYLFEPWDDRDLVVGEGWHEEIQAAIARCHFGLLLLSPRFLASQYIRDHELPKFVPGQLSDPESGKRAVPVALKKLNFNREIDLRGLESRQIFRDSEGKAFHQRRYNRKDEFAEELCEQIIRMVAKHFPPSSPPTTPAPGSTSRERFDNLYRHTRSNIGENFDADRFIPTQGIVESLDKLERQDERQASPGERRDALEFLDEWVGNPQGQPYCALLGEYGMGKTTTCLAFTQELLNKRAGDTTLPLPIYLDLRHLGDRAKSEPRLDEIIGIVLERSWRGGRLDVGLNATEVIRLVQEEGALVIFDGLDEVLVHLSPAAGQRFTRELYRILPPAPDKNTLVTPKRGRLLITCRTHYFRTLRDQKTHLTAEGRDRIRADDYRAFVLLPFTEAQIREYLAHSLPDGDDPDRVLELFRTVHDLSEMAERPYTLSLITAHIPQIERWKLEGRPVTGVMLYRHMVQSWLERDAGKHQIIPDHKQRLMEYFAAALWRSGQRLWSVGDLEDWLMDFLGEHPRIAAHYGNKDRELLKEDLRAATFLVRKGEDEFRFAHTSLQEFFLAAYLHRALCEQRFDGWGLAEVSRETLGFLGQMLAEDEQPNALASLRTLRDSYRPRASELAFTYGLLAHSKGYPAPSLAGFRLEGVDLRGWRIEGRADEPPLNLRGIVLRGARLDGAVLRRADLERADFTDAHLARAECRDVRARAACFRGADLTGTVFREALLDDAGFEGARCYRSQWLRCRLDGATGLPRSAPQVLYALCEPATIYTTLPPADASLTVINGHCGPINACAFAPDGRRLVSGSFDGTLRLWDVETGQETSRRIHFFGDDTWASLDLAANRILQVSGDAWRWLTWLGRDPDSGRLERYPAEAFGPLPGERDQPST